MGTRVESITYEGEYPTGTYWSVGEIRELDEDYIDDLPDGLSVVVEEMAEASAEEGTTTAAEWDVVAEAARSGGDEVAAEAAETTSAVLTGLEDADADAEPEVSAAEDAALRLHGLADDLEAKAAALDAAADAIEAAAADARAELG